MKATTDDSKRYLQKINAHLDAARAYSKLSHAVRLKVGSVIVREDRIVSVGYNGTPTGRSNICEIQMVDGLVSKSEVCHAEANAILFAAKNGIPTDQCTIIITHSPCFECAKMIIQSGITEMIYETLYRDDSSLSFLKESGIKVKQINGEILYEL